MRSSSSRRIGKATDIPALLILVCLAFSLPRAEAATLVFEWGGTYVTENTSFTATPVEPGVPGQTYYQYSSTTPIGTAGGKLYGTFLLEEAGTTPVFSQFGYRGNPNTIAVGAVAGDNAMTMRGLYYFGREDFLVPGSMPITFDEDSVAAFTVTSSGGSSRMSKLLIHALVDGEWNWYVSQRTGVGTTTNTIDSLGTSLWALYSFSEDAPLAPVPTSTNSYSIEGSLFEDVDAIGVYFNYTRPARVSPTDSRGLSFYVSNISLTAQAIPEPSVALLGGFGLVCLGAGWLRRRRSAAKAG